MVEIGTSAIVPALTNAIFAVTGKRCGLIAQQLHSTKLVCGPARRHAAASWSTFLNRWLPACAAEAEAAYYRELEEPTPIAA
jgi:hypothetical protein